MEQWSEIVTRKYDKTTAAARENIDSAPHKETADQYTSQHSKSGKHRTSSKRSSQRQLEIEISKLEKEEHGKQHEAEDSS